MRHIDLRLTLIRRKRLQPKLLACPRRRSGSGSTFITLFLFANCSRRLQGVLISFLAILGGAQALADTGDTAATASARPSYLRVRTPRAHTRATKQSDHTRETRSAEKQRASDASRGRAPRRSPPSPPQRTRQAVHAAAGAFTARDPSARAGVPVKRAVSAG